MHSARCRRNADIITSSAHLRVIRIRITFSSNSVRIYHG